MHRTHTPAARRGVDGLAVIGRTLHDLRGIRYEDGENGNAPAAGTAPAAAAPVGTPAAPAPAPAGTPAAGAAPLLGPDGQPFDPVRAQERIATLNAENRTRREAAEAAEAARAASEGRLSAVLTALGLQADGSAAPKTPEQLAAEVAASTSAQEATARENLVLRVSPALGANADRLLDSRAFATALSALKVDDTEGVKALVLQTVTNDPSLKNVPAPAAASGDTSHNGAANSGTGRKTREAANAAHYANKSK